MSVLGRLFVMVLLSALLFSKSLAQDIHFSQYYNSPLNLNPAQAGMFREDTRYIVNGRQQWASVPVNYLTFSGSFDQKLNFQKVKNSFFTNGAVFNYDRTGDSRMSLLQMAWNGSYVKKIGELNLISVGAQFGFRSRYFEDKGLTFDHQFDGFAYNPNAPTAENFNNYSTFFLDFGVGLNYRMQLKDKRSHLDFGFGMYHPQQPKVNFQKDASYLYSRKVYHVLTTFKINRRWDVLTNVGGQAQGPYNAFFLSHFYRVYLSQGKYTHRAFQFGVSYRYAEREDAVIPAVEFHTERYRFGLSYDITLSQFRIANGGRGGPELSLQYLITKVKALKSSKSCPIF